MKKKYFLTIVVPLRNTKEYHRDSRRLQDCLNSLKNQTVPHNQIDIIVSDLDSDIYNKAKHAAICKTYKVKYLFTETGNAWNISRARNIGIRNAKADFIMTTDVDCVFAPDFIEVILRHAAEDKIIHCRISDLPGNYDDKLDEFLWMNKVSVLRPPFGYGGCQVFSKKWAFNVHGFDEVYSVWGADDTDFYLRATQDGLESVWIERETSFFHQYHETENNEKNRVFVNTNRLRLKMTEMGKLPIIRNESGWGGKGTISAPLAKTSRAFNDVAILVTTFMRDSALFQCIKSIQTYYPNMAIFVADNGKPNEKKRQFCKAHECTLVASPFDSGVGSARNAVFSTLPKQYKYVVICEDDVLFTDETRLENWVAVLEAEEDIGIVGGILKKYGAKTLITQNYEAWLYAKADMLYIEKIDMFDWKMIAGIKYAPCDIVINIFMMKREVWDSQKWDSSIKTWPEHEDFFFSLKKNTPWKVAYTDTVSFIHKATPYDEPYAKYRMRIDGVGIFARKWGIEYIWNSWHKDWGKPNPMRIGLLVPGKQASGVIQKRKADIAIGIKTFLREASLFETLDAVEKHFPCPYKLYIADDGGATDEKEYRYQKLEAAGHTIIRLPFNCGISVGRNEIVKRITEKYLLLMDDDIVLQNRESIEHMKAVLDSDKDIGLCSGMLFGKNGEHIGNENYQKGLRFEIDGGILFRYPAHREIHKTNGSMYVIAEQVVNFFIAKKAIFDDVKWDNRIKVEWEHIDFFLRLKQTHWKVAACLDTKALHLNPINDSTYNYHRRSVTNQYFFQKHNIHNVINRFH